jgi:hypothetical protein
LALFEFSRLDVGATAEPSLWVWLGLRAVATAKTVSTSIIGATATTVPKTGDQDQNRADLHRDPGWTSRATSSELKGDDDRGEAGGDEEGQPVAGDERAASVGGARSRGGGEDGEPDGGPGLLAGGEQGASQPLVAGMAIRRVLLMDYATLGLPVALVRATIGRLPASPLYDLIRSDLSSLRPGHEESVVPRTRSYTMPGT